MFKHATNADDVMRNEYLYLYSYQVSTLRITSFQNTEQQKLAPKAAFLSLQSARLVWEMVP